MIVILLLSFERCDNRKRIRHISWSLYLYKIQWQNWIVVNTEVPLLHYRYCDCRVYQYYVVTRWFVVCTLLFHSIFRYFYIGQYQKYLVYFTSKKILFYVCLLWSMCVIICIPNQVGWGDVKFSPVLYFCWLDTSTYSYLSFYTIVKVIAIVIAFVFYIKIYLTIRKSSLSKALIVGKRAKEEQNQEESKAKGGLSEHKVAEELKIIKVTFKIFILFAVCWTPLIILFLLTAVYSGPQWLYLCASFLGHSNSTLNFIVYFLDNNVFRKALLKCIKNKIHDHETSVVFTASVLN